MAELFESGYAFKDENDLWGLYVNRHGWNHGVEYHTVLIFSKYHTYEDLQYDAFKERIQIIQII